MRQITPQTPSHNVPAYSTFALSAVGVLVLVGGVLLLEPVCKAMQQPGGANAGCAALGILFFIGAAFLVLVILTAMVIGILLSLRAWRRGKLDRGLASLTLIAALTLTATLINYLSPLLSIALLVTSRQLSQVSVKSEPNPFIERALPFVWGIYAVAALVLGIWKGGLLHEIRESFKPHPEASRMAE